jgi:WhiB family transcriptional regulator, redox-sensing transcriptional regulator
LTANERRNDHVNLPGFNFTLNESDRWTATAACAEEGVAPMFPSEQDAKGIEYAKSICERCPVRDRCLADALDRGESFGIWGGMTSDERRALRRKEARTKSALSALDATALDVAARPAYQEASPIVRPLVG